MMRSGIYKILCNGNGKMYIGQSKYIPARLSKHKKDLIKNRHFSTYLQRSFNKYGIESFEFLVEKYCEIDKLNDEEKIVYEFYKAIDKTCLFNIRPNPCNSRGMQFLSRRGVPSWNAGTSGKGIMKPNKTSFVKGQIPPNKGVPMTDEVRKKVSLSKKGKPSTKKGKPMSDLSRYKMSIAKKGKKRGTATRINLYIDRLGVFHTTKDVTKLFDIHRSTLQLWEANNDKRLIHYKRV